MLWGALAEGGQRPEIAARGYLDAAANEASDATFMVWRGGLSCIPPRQFLVGTELDYLRERAGDIDLEDRVK